MRISLLGEPMDVVTADDVFDLAAERLRAGEKAIIANHNLHSLSLIDQPGMRAFYQMADLTIIDSMPLIAWAKLLGLSVSRKNRCTYLDYRNDFWTRAARRGWRVFFLGGGLGVGVMGARHVQEEFMVTIGVHHGFFDMNGPDNDEVIDQINAFRPDIVFVGMGMPLQEQWIAANFDRLTQGVVLPIGAAFDYEAGVQKAAPRWMGRMGVEWAFRLVSDPARLFARYVVEPWMLAPRAIRDLRSARKASHPAAASSPQ